MGAAAIPPPPRSRPSADASGARSEVLIGKMLDGRFLVDGILGEGGMGTVYAGTDRVDGRRVAIKILRSDYVSDSEIVQRFLNEAQAASQIGSPHICSVFGIGGAPNGAAYFVMEFLQGDSLAGLLDRERVLAIRRILRIGHQIAVGLSAAHAAGIIHRDLKPDNIMIIEREGTPEFVKILDFGVAKISSSRSKLTRAGSVFGTPQYMSPEQAAGSPVDPRADVYSLGIILYEMCAGGVPFDDENMMNVLTHQMFRDPRDVGDVAPQVVPSEFNAIVRKCLQKNPKLRYGSMQELADELERAGQILPADRFEKVIPDSKRPFTDTGPRGLSATVPELPRVKRSRIGLVAAGLVAAIVCGIGGLFLFGQHDSRDPMLAEMPAVTPAAGGAVAEARVVTLAITPANATLVGATERSRTQVGDQARVMVEAPTSTALVRVAAAGYRDQTVELRPDTSSLTIALQSAAVAPTDGAVATGTKKKGGSAPVRPTAPAKPAAAVVKPNCVGGQVNPFDDCKR